MRYGFGYHHHDHWGAMAVIMPILWLVVIGLLVWVAVRVLHRTSFNTGYAAPPSTLRETPEEVLDRRFAAGEIDAEAHAAARQHLKDHPR